MKNAKWVLLLSLGIQSNFSAALAQEVSIKPLSEHGYWLCENRLDEFLVSVRKLPKGDRKIALVACRDHLDRVARHRQRSPWIPSFQNVIGSACKAWDSFLQVFRTPTREEWIRYYQAQGQYSNVYQDTFGRRP